MLVRCIACSTSNSSFNCMCIENLVTNCSKQRDLSVVLAVMKGAKACLDTTITKKKIKKKLCNSRIGGIVIGGI